MCLRAIQPHQRYVLHANLSSCQLLPYKYQCLTSLPTKDIPANQKN